MDKKPQKKNNRFDSTPTVLHCRRCGTEMQNGVCPNCGFKIYMPMDKEKQQKIKLVATVVLMAIAVVLFVALQFKKN